MTTAQCLCGQWNLTFGDLSGPAPTSVSELEALGLTSVVASVPGNFELDLHAAGLLPDPMVGMNMAELQRFDRAHLWFARRFPAQIDPGLDPFLVFEGLDCYADVYLNGRLIARSDNMLVEWRFPVEGALLPENEILVHIRPPLPEAAQYEYGPGIGAMEANYESLHVRKAPHMYGWDIMPRALSGGIWRPVRLEQVPKDRIEWCHLETVGTGNGYANLVLSYETKLTDPAATYEVEVCGAHEGASFEASKRIRFGTGRLRVTALQPHLWWPRGRGSQSLYSVEVRLLRDGEVVNASAFRHGIRTVELRRTETVDAGEPGEFHFVVNGERFYAMGANWVPADAFHSRDRERIPRMLDLAEECGCNMLRCWGGNVYEDDLFYDLCDQKGLLVWQDFSLACAVYPQDDTFCARIADEARRVVRRLRGHACLALWAGDNECDLAYDWFHGSSGDPNTNRLTREVLPSVLRLEDPRRPYLPSSPYLDPAALRLGARGRAEDHLWGPRDHYKSAFYTHSTCRFASEIGYHGCPSPESIRRFISPDKLWPPGNDEWLLHATSPIPGAGLYDYRIGLMSDQILAMFGRVPDTLEEYARQSQIIQAEAFKFFIELFRMGKWYRTGMLWWNLIDGWPQFSDAVVDYYFGKKLAFAHIAASQQALCVMMREPDGWRQEIVACNDTRDDLALAYAVRDADSGEILAQGSGIARGDSVTALGTIPVRSNGARWLLLDWTTTLGRGANHYLAGSPPFRSEDVDRWMQTLAGFRRGAPDA